MKQNYRKLIVCLVLLTMPFALPLTASAHDEESEEATTTQRPTEKRPEAQRQGAEKDRYDKNMEEMRAEKSRLSTKNEEMRAESRQKLDDAKKRMCERHQKNINNLMTRIVSAREKQVAHIDEIASRVQAYYQKNELSVDDYDVLVADVAAKKVAADEALANAKPETPFSCDSTGPKADLQEFRGKRDAAVDAIREYRISVKNLIKAVKDAKKAANEESSNE